MGNSKILAVLLGLSLLSSAAHVNSAGNTSNAKKADVRLLIDISGSMKQNDPNNLRIPALQLVTNLLPKGSDAGVWAFGRYINMLVPLSSVDAKWQITATNTANKINSAGLYTNIGRVLEKASYGWTIPDPLEKRSMILLTDGMVDISKDASVNAKERTRILNVVLPKLKKAGVSIHTIALSENADHELLKQLSIQTDGWYQAVNNATELQKVFLKIFEQAAERDNLPITDNQFSVDKSIDEMTVLIFRKDSTSPAKLVSPSGKTLDKDSAGSALRWFSTTGYDLVTLQKPETGEWKIDAQVDPDNRVMVVSKLGLSIAELPNNLLAGEAINYEMQLLEDGKIISNPDFLSLVDTILEQNIAGKTSKLAMFYDGSSYTFKQNFFTDSFEGELKLRLNVTSPTFERVRTHAINIYGSPLVADVEISSDNIAPHKVHLSVREDIVRPQSLQINATVTKPDGEKVYLVVDNPLKPLEISPDLTGGDYIIEFKITGESVLGRQFSVSPGSINFSGVSLIAEQKPKVKLPDPVVEKTVIETPIIEKKVEETEKPTVVEEKQQPDLKKEPAEEEPVEEEQEEPVEKEQAEPVEEEPSINWLYVTIGGNLLLAIIGFFVWQLIKKRSTTGALAVASELGLDDEDDDDDDEEKEVDGEDKGKND